MDKAVLEKPCCTTLFPTKLSLSHDTDDNRIAYAWGTWMLTCYGLHILPYHGHIQASCAHFCCSLRVTCYRKFLQLATGIEWCLSENVIFLVRSKDAIKDKFQVSKKFQKCHFSSKKQRCYQQQVSSFQKKILLWGCTHLTKRSVKKQC